MTWVSRRVPVSHPCAARTLIPRRKWVPYKSPLYSSDVLNLGSVKGSLLVFTLNSGRGPLQYENYALKCEFLRQTIPCSSTGFHGGGYHFSFTIEWQQLHSPRTLRLVSPLSNWCWVSVGVADTPDNCEHCFSMASPWNQKSREPVPYLHTFSGPLLSKVWSCISCFMLHVVNFKKSREFGKFPRLCSAAAFCALRK